MPWDIALVTASVFNKSFKEWGDIFGDSVEASALLDRLLHHCHIVNIRCQRCNNGK